MSPELADLLVDAVRLLPAERQDEVLRALLQDTRTGQGAGPHLARPDLLTSAATAGRAARLLEAPFEPGPLSSGPRQTVPVRLSEAQHERLKRWCQENDFSMAVVIRGLVDRFLDDRAGAPPGATRSRPAG